MIQSVIQSVPKSRTKQLHDNNPFIWNDDDFAKDNYARLGERLAATGDFFRMPGYASGLILLLPNGKPIQIEHGKDLLPAIIDRVQVQIIRDGKPKGGRIPAAHLNSMLMSESFLSNFRSVDRISTHSTGTGKPVRRRNDLVLAISTNFGMVSEDILNRSLPIHLAPKGDVADRRPVIGNPKHEFLPANREKITSELLGMVNRWKAGGMPLDLDVRHPFSLWAKTIGGILKVNGFSDFLGNYGKRRTADDPIKNGLAILGAARPDEWLRPGEWAAVMVEQGLTKTLIDSHERDTDAGRKRALGVLMTAHLDEVFEAATESVRLRLQLKHARRRFGGSQPQDRYCFEELERVPLPVNEDQGAT